MRHVFQTAIVFAFVTAIGCQAKLTVSKTIKVPSDEGIGNIQKMPAQPSAQTITVSINVKSGSNVDVFVLPASLLPNDEVGTSPDEKKTWEEKGYGFKREMKSGSMTAKIPANVEYRVLIIQSDDAKEKSEVELKITN